MDDLEIHGEILARAAWRRVVVVGCSWRMRMTWRWDWYASGGQGRPVEFWPGQQWPDKGRCTGGYSCAERCSRVG